MRLKLNTFAVSKFITKYSYIFNEKTNACFLYRQITKYKIEETKYYSNILTIEMTIKCK